MNNLIVSRKTSYWFAIRTGTLRLNRAKAEQKIQNVQQ